ncbi:MAG: succinyl-diaminopimelate desuccinylase [Devosiaceae bacterium]|nr:succinyl-diaminopimelate desuccinylase [Devosiaceae bacterium]
MSDQTIATDTKTLLQDLVRCRSVTPDEAGVLDVLEAFLTPLGFNCTRVKFEGNGSYPVDNLFATRGTKGRHLLFGGHTDVVPAGNANDWTHDPFEAIEAEGQIWGRGAVDMKSGVAAFCAATAVFVGNQPDKNGIISLAITNDEEADAINGTQKLLEWAVKQGHKFDFSIVGEPSSAKILGDNIKVGRRGSISGIVCVRGKQGHSAYPEQANNPVPVLANLTQILSDTKLDDGTEHFQPSNLEVTSIDIGNKATNIIPAMGTLSFNIRFNETWDGPSISAWIEARIGEVEKKGFEIGWQRVTAIADCFVSPISEDVKIVSEAVKSVTGLVPELATFGGTSDARFIAKYCPVVECGLVGQTMHQVDERVEVFQLYDLEKIYLKIMDKFFSNA